MVGANLTSRSLDWLDERTGYRSLLATALDEPIPGGSRWAYVFGSALLVTLVLQAVTGTLLTFYYVPSIDHAHTTVAYVQKEVPLGWLVRGVHYYGASAVIVIMLLHLAQVFVWGAYKERREALWLAGVILLQLVLGFGFTGYLLPWDQKAYFGTQVAGGIAGSIPLVGPDAARALLGGAGIGQATLSRFFALHVFVLPALTALLIVAHLYLFRHAGPAGPLSDDPRARERVERFYPMQFFKDTAAAMAVVGLLAALAYARPALLGPKADPAAGFVPRPEWYFLWTFQLLKYMPAFLGAVVVPGVLMTALALAPFVDRSPARALRARLIPVGLFLAALAGIGGLTYVSIFEDLSDLKIQQQEEAARRFMDEPFAPDVIGAPPPAAAAAPPPTAFAENGCAGCHGAAGEGGPVGPSLKGITAKPSRTPDDLVKLLADPTAYGVRPPMPAFADMPEAERRAIADWIATLK
jgi:ubiquinol-cytochrome c reductase cytochrome b subunit